MKHMNLKPAKHSLFIAAAVLAASILSLLPWSLIAQPESEVAPTPTTTPATTSRGRVGGMGSGGFGRGMPASAIAPTTPPAIVAPARFEATIYEITTSDNHIADIDAEKLEAVATTPQSLAAALKPFGSVKVLYKVDQIVNLYGEKIQLGANEPMVSSTRKDPNGNNINSVSYTSVGLITRISAASPADSKSTQPEVQLNFELSAFTSSGLEISSGVPANSIRTVALSQSGTPKFGKPSVLVTVSASGASEKTSPVAYIVRYLFTQPKS
jgi:hypothetical protein